MRRDKHGCGDFLHRRVLWTASGSGRIERTRGDGRAKPAAEMHGRIEPVCGNRSDRADARRRGGAGARETDRRTGLVNGDMRSKASVRPRFSVLAAQRTAERYKRLTALVIMVIIRL